jgi:hypothetical protein
MQPKSFKQSLKYNPLLLPKEHKQAIQNINYDLWNDLSIININFPKDEITIDHIIKDFGKTYGIDLKLGCKNKTVQQLLDAAYEKHMRLPRFTKHEHFEAMLADQ